MLFLKGENVIKTTLHHNLFFNSSILIYTPPDNMAELSAQSCYDLFKAFDETEPFSLSSTTPLPDKPHGVHFMKEIVNDGFAPIPNTTTPSSNGMIKETKSNHLKNKRERVRVMVINTLFMELSNIIPWESKVPKTKKAPLSINVIDTGSMVSWCIHLTSNITVKKILHINEMVYKNT